MVRNNNFSEDEAQAPPDKKLSDLPPKLAAKIRRQRARQRLLDREEQPDLTEISEEAVPASLYEEKEAVTHEQEAGESALESDDEQFLRPEELPADDEPADLPPPVSPPVHTPAPSGAFDIKPRKVPTVSGFFQELGRGAWESLSDLIESNVRRLKRRRLIGEEEYLIITEEVLQERRQKIRGYVLLSSAIHILLFLPLIHLAMIQEPEKKPPIYVRILDTPPPAKKVEKKTTEAKTTKTTKEVKKVVKAKGPRPEPQPVTRPTPTKTYASPKKVVVAKASQPAMQAPSAPRIPRTAPTQLEAPRPKTNTAPLTEEPVAKITTPTRPLTLPETLPKVASVTETLRNRQSPVETRPTDLKFDVPTVPDTEGRAAQLKEAVPESFQARDQFAAPTAAPSLPPNLTPAPSVLGQAATVASQTSPGSPNVLAPEQATTSVRPVDERRTASNVVASLGGETGPESPTQPVSFSDTNEMGPVGSAPTEFREEITVPLNSDDPRFKEYLEAVKRRILEIWRYPDDAEPGLRGKVSIEFAIERDGSVSRVNVVSPSGYGVLDRGATNAMRLASPFPPLPSEFNTNRLKVVGGFRYN